MKVWLPALRCGSGTDVFTQRLADGLRAQGVAAEITWCNRWFELCPWPLAAVPVPAGTTLIHTNSWATVPFARAGLPLVVTEHLAVLDPLADGWKTPAQRLYHRLHIGRQVRAAYQRADRLLAVSRFVADGVARATGVAASVLHNGVDTAFFSPAATERAGDRPLRLLFAGNLSVRKGADLLPGLLDRLGDGFVLRYTTGLRPHPALPPSPRCTPLGRLDAVQMREQYRWCDALLLPSRFEGLPLVALEAMACGKPVLGFAGQALDELVDDGVHGLLVPMNDLAALATACQTLHADRRTLAGMGEAARARVAAAFSLDRMIERHLAVYAQLAGL